MQRLMKWGSAWHPMRTLAGGVTLALCACATDPQTGAQSVAGIKVSDDPCAKTATTVGAVLGGVAGAVIGSQASKRGEVRVAATVAGAVIGGLIGHDIDGRRCELFKIAKKHDITLSVAELSVPEGALPVPGSSAPSVQPRAEGRPANESVSEGGRRSVAGLIVAVQDAGRQFEPGSDQLTPHARAYFADIAEQYAYGKQVRRLQSNAPKEQREAVELLRTKRILLIGHTDDTGGSRANADLSERRALAVARVFRDQGIPDVQLFYQGAGETLPVADNHSDEGRAQNRRVEIVDVTDDATLHKYLAMRLQRVEFYRAALPGSSASPAPGRPKSAGPVAPGATSGSQGASTAAAPPQPAPATPAPTGTASDSGPAAAGSTRPRVPIAQPAVPVFDFGGNPASTTVAAADFGREVAPRSLFSLIPAAYAAGGPVVPTCRTDRPRISNGVKSLRDQKNISVTQYMPGLYNTSWMDTVNGNLVGLANVAVLRDGGAPANKPNLYVYRDYKLGNGAKPDFVSQPDVNAYRGDKAMLYRVFVDGPIRCLDVVFPYDNSGEARNSNLYYDKHDDVYVTAFKPKIAR